MSAGVCPKGHILLGKKTTGGVLQTAKKSCYCCGNLIHIGEMRYLCRECWKNYCQPCFDAGLTSVEPSRPGGFKPGPRPVSAPSTPSSRPKSPARTAPPVPSQCVPCRWGAACYNWDPEHRRRFQHPDQQDMPKRRACKYGKPCWRIDQQHRAQYAHPGDRYYRFGLVEFDGGLQPELDSLREIFQFYDPDESGHLSREEFKEAMQACLRLAASEEKVSTDESWKRAGGPVTGYINFRQFVGWTLSINLALPMGLDDSKASRPCRFRIMNRSSACCQCEAYEASSDGFLCVCGHKPSMHRSDIAEMSANEYLRRTATMMMSWDRTEGLIEMTDPGLLAKIQKLLMATHLNSDDNWTRDRGCKLHGVNGCSPACASKNRTAVPTHYIVEKVFRNQNIDLWKKYALHREEITEECSGKYNDTDGSSWKPVRVQTSEMELEMTYHKECNEWLLFHGTSHEKCQGICSSGFRIALAGTGATWKEKGKTVGQPLYGSGVYLAERITKADEYATPSSVTSPSSGEDHRGGKALCSVLLCRVLGGRVNVVETNEIEVEKLRKSVFDGPCHSVLGDRIKKLGKPYREVVVYDKDQIYPEYLVQYRRGYGKE